MHIDLYLVLGSAVVGLLVGLTGVGGGALMTPMLVLVFGVTPTAAITSDLVAALLMKPAGALIHWRKKTVHTGLVKYLCYGSLPGAFLGTYAMHLLGQSAVAEHRLQILLGTALIIGALAMLGRTLLPPTSSEQGITVRRGATIAIGAVGGFMVGLTSVGAGSLILVLLLFLYPSLRSSQLVGTDLAQSVPLTLSATLGTLIFSHVDFSLTTSIIVGSVPAVVVGSLLSSRANGVALRRVITATVLLSGLKYVGLPTPALGVVAVVLALAIIALAMKRARQKRPVVAPLEESVAEAV
ncbi:MAG TPA: sulfite exporter TauE/SafE family protein [Acidimicrobiales bacterium]|nr:sulfite exporter TauE/SafE family protein [Acidimicrobiales bacterium]